MAEAERRFASAPIDSGGGGFAGMSHRGSLLPAVGMHAWPLTDTKEFSLEAFEPVFAEAANIDILLIGTGKEIAFFSEALRWRFRDLKISVDVMPTGPAAQTWNILLAEDRRVAAALIASP